jgi:diguanylate cyclase (GGDEF)-like protein
VSAVPGDFGEGLFYGALLAMVAAHALIALSLREGAHLWFALFAAGLGLSTFAWDGHGARFLWPGSPRFDAASGPALDAATALFAIQFARSYLRTAALAPRADRALRTLAAASAALVPVAAAAPVWLAHEAVAILSVAGPCALLAAGVARARAGDFSARYYLAAHALFLVGVVVEVGATYVAAAPPPWTEAGTYAGSLVALLAFSVGLAERYKATVREREEARAAGRALWRESRRDGLTGLWNRRHLDEQLEAEWRRALREGTPLAVLLVDVDHFKRFNDRHGHLAGDECLRRVAAAVGAQLRRPGDLAARYGGEELAVLLPGLGATEAREVGEAVRAAVEALALPHADSEAGPFVTVSVGAAAHLPRPGGSVAQLVSAADAALYEAKRAGRNRVCGAPATGSSSGGRVLPKREARIEEAEMDDDVRELAASFAEAIGSEDFARAHELLAPWLRARLSSEALQTLVEKELHDAAEGLDLDGIEYPTDYEIGSNASTLAQLRAPRRWTGPRDIPPEVTDANFRQWLMIEWQPAPGGARPDYWFRWWLIVVELEGELAIGYFGRED